MTTDPIEALRLERLHHIPEREPAREALREAIALLANMLDEIDREKTRLRRSYDRMERTA